MIGPYRRRERVPARSGRGAERSRCAAPRARTASWKRLSRGRLYGQCGLRRSGRLVWLIGPGFVGRGRGDGWPRQDAAQGGAGSAPVRALTTHRGPGTLLLGSRSVGGGATPELRPNMRWGWPMLPPPLRQPRFHWSNDNPICRSGCRLRSADGGADFASLVSVAGPRQPSRTSGRPTGGTTPAAGGW